MTPSERLQRARDQLALLKSYGNDGGIRGDQARAEIADAQAELDAQTPEPVADPEPKKRGGHRG